MACINMRLKFPMTGAVQVMKLLCFIDCLLSPNDSSTSQ